MTLQFCFLMPQKFLDEDLRCWNLQLLFIRCKENHQLVQYNQHRSKQHLQMSKYPSHQSWIIFLLHFSTYPNRNDRHQSLQVWLKGTSLSTSYILRTSCICKWICESSNMWKEYMVRTISCVLANRTITVKKTWQHTFPFFRVESKCASLNSTA